MLWIKHLAQYLGYMDIKHKYSREPAVIYSAGLKAWTQDFNTQHSLALLSCLVCESEAIVFKVKR